MRKKKIVFGILKYAVLIIGIVLILFPLYVTVNTALKTQSEVSRSFFTLPSSFYLGNFYQVISEARFYSSFSNSLLVTVVSVALMMVLIPMLSFAISRNFNKKYFVFVYYFILSGIFIPFQAVMLPIYKNMGDLGLLNQYGLIIQYLAFSLAQGTFLCVGHLKSISMQLDEAAKIDGCSVWKTYTKIIFPLMRPIIVTVLVIDLLWVWNDFQLPLIMLNRSPSYWTLPLYIYNFMGEYTTNYPVIFAGFFLTMIPIIIIYLFLQKDIIGGLTEGAIK